MPRGGARPGAGRKPGVPNRRTRQVQEAVEATGSTPLDVMLKAMREAYAEGRLMDAAKFAAMAAPYVHPKLAPIEWQRPYEEGGDLRDMPLDELERRIRHLIMQ